MGRRILRHQEQFGRRTAAAPPSLTPTGQYLDGVSRPQVYNDPDGGRWLGKKGPKGRDFPAQLDVATSGIQQRAGLPAAETHLMDIDGGPASVQKMFDADPAFPDNRVDLQSMDPSDVLELQKHMALDWMLSNHDAHSGNFLRDRNTGGIVGIDKGQAFKYFGQDSLSPSFGNDVNPPLHPNRPVYSTMLDQFARGQGQLHDPRSGDYGDFINSLQSIPDDEYRSYLAPYAESAAGVGKLSTGDPQAFLDAAVARKNSLSDDLGSLYDTVRARQPQTVATILRQAGVGFEEKRTARTEQVGVGGRLPTNEVASYFHSIITPEDLEPDFDADVRANGVHTPIEISTDGSRAAIADGHHRTLSAQGGGLPDVPVHVYRVHPSSMDGRGGEVGEFLQGLLRDYPEAIYREAVRQADVTFPYLRNNNGMRDIEGFGQEHEPWGRYMAPDIDEHKLPLQPGWERGTVDFEEPLYVPHEYGDWKQSLSRDYGDLTGKELSQALIDKGFDGVITHDKFGLGEIVDIRPKGQRGHRVTGHAYQDDPDFIPNKEQWMWSWSDDEDDLVRDQLEFEDIPRPQNGNANPALPYIPYDPALVPSPGMVTNSQGDQRHWWKETPESLQSWQHDLERMPGEGQQPLWGPDNDFPTRFPGEPHPHYGAARQHTAADLYDEYMSAWNSGGTKGRFPWWFDVTAYGDDAYEAFQTWLEDIGEPQWEEWENAINSGDASSVAAHEAMKTSFNDFLTDNEIPSTDEEKQEIEHQQAVGDDTTKYSPDGHYTPGASFDPDFEDRPPLPGVKDDRRYYPPHGLNPESGAMARPHTELSTQDPEQPMLPLPTSEPPEGPISGELNDLLFDAREGPSFGPLREMNQVVRSPGFQNWFENVVPDEKKRDYTGTGLKDAIEEYQQSGDQYEWPQDRAPIDMWRGMKINLNHPDLGEVRRSLYGDQFEDGSDPSSRPLADGRSIVEKNPLGFDNPELGGKLLDWVEQNYGRRDTGLGRHWSTDSSMAAQWAQSGSGGAPGQVPSLPMRIRQEWKGQGEDPYRTNTGGHFDEENEVTMLPGAPVNIADVQIRHPQTFEWHSVLDAPHQRTASDHDLSLYHKLQKAWTNDDFDEVPWAKHYGDKAWGSFNDWLHDISDDQWDDWAKQLVDDNGDPGQAMGDIQQSFEDHLNYNDIPHTDEEEWDDTEDEHYYDPFDFYDPDHDKRPDLPGHPGKKYYSPTGLNPHNNTEARPDIEFEEFEPDDPMLPLPEPPEYGYENGVNLGVGGHDRLREKFYPPQDPEFIEWAREKYDMDPTAEGFDGTGIFKDKTSPFHRSQDYRNIAWEYRDTQKPYEWPLDREPIDLYRGKPINLTAPGNGELRRSLYGDEYEGQLAENNLDDGLFPQPPAQAWGVGKGVNPDGSRYDLDPFDNPALGDLVLDALERQRFNREPGVGRHFSDDPSVARNNFSKGQGLPVAITDSWKGQGEDPYRANTGGAYGNEREITKIPYAPINVSDVEIKHPETGQWRSVLVGNPERMAARELEFCD